MRSSFLFLALGSSLLFVLPQSRAQDRFELFGGYSFVHASVPVTSTILCPAPICPFTTAGYRRNLNGWEFAGAYKPISLLGLTADFNGTYGSVGSSRHAPPDLSLRSYSRFSRSGLSLCSRPVRYRP